MKLLTLLVFLLILNSSSHACEFQLITNEFPPFVAKLSTPFQDVLRQIRGQRILQIQQILNKSRFQINSFTPKSLNVLSDNDIRELGLNVIEVRNLYQNQRNHIKSMEKSSEQGQLWTSEDLLPEYLTENFSDLINLWMQHRLRLIYQRLQANDIPRAPKDLKLLNDELIFALGLVPVEVRNMYQNSRQAFKNGSDAYRYLVEASGDDYHSVFLSENGRPTQRAIQLNQLKSLNENNN